MSIRVMVKVNNAALASVLNVVQGGVVHVICKNGIPVNREWRNRFKDAEIDNCITILKDAPDQKPKKGGK